MALVQCHECGKSISTEASSCPQCGAPSSQSASAPAIAASPNATQPRITQEETLHTDNDVSVTTTRVIIRGTTYALRNITSVRLATTKPTFGIYALRFFGVVIFICVLLVLAGFSQGFGHGLLWLIVTGGVVAGIYWLRTLIPHQYHVALSNATGEENALTSKDKPYIERVVKSINDAIVKYQ